jgi:hypothetical protein
MAHSRAAAGPSDTSLGLPQYRKFALEVQVKTLYEQ